MWSPIEIREGVVEEPGRETPKPQVWTQTSLARQQGLQITLDEFVKTLFSVSE